MCLDGYDYSTPISVQSHITSEELFQHIYTRYKIHKLEQWNEVSSTWVPIYSAEDIGPAEGAKFRAKVRMCTVSLLDRPNGTGC